MAFTEFDAAQILTADQLNTRFPQGHVFSVVDEGTDVTSGTTELVVSYGNFTAVAGRRYKLEYGAPGFGTVGGDAFRVRFRYLATAGALTSAGTAFMTRDINGLASTIPTFWTYTVTGLTAQSYAIGITVQRTAGTGTYTFAGSVNSQKLLELYDVGPS